MKIAALKPRYKKVQGERNRLSVQIDRLQADVPFLLNVKDYGGWPIDQPGEPFYFCGEAVEVIDRQGDWVVLQRAIFEKGSK